MSLLDQMAGMLGGKMGQYQTILTWINQQGGIDGLLDKFRKGGLSTIVESWLSSGASMPVSAAQIESVLGTPAIAELAGMLGLDTLKTSSLISKYLPEIVDGLSPEGKVDGQQDLLTAGMNLLKGKLFS
ncbi:DUF937 domain-containing protein [Buttiauxella sp. B2]|uniref:YidB family protein n=1 Tax=Buttiauxella sp. B2 TaxID=2587812 RepID=UPI001121C50F|nr:YidB family protein [Buttiauxella sp. B2]TNV12505.1 DUF937 domain-containing protein [Buttiauxella sp. B2]